MKNSKKKVLVAAVLAGVLLLGAIVSVVLVLAAQQQNISSNIRITYSVDGVGAKVSAKYGSIKPTGEVNLANMTTPDGVSTELNFSVSDTNGGASLTPNGDITLTQATGTEVVFEYRFENTADTLFSIGMKSTGTAVNIAEYYYVSTEPLAANKYGKIAEPLLTGTTAGELVIPKQAMLSSENPGNVIYIYVKVAVANINKSASYEKNYNWELKQLTTEQVPFDLALDNGDGSGANSVKVIKGAVVPVMATLPSAPAGKGFAGYYDAQTDGNLIVSKNGIGVKEISSETTLYARYDEASVLDTAGTTLFGFNPTASATTSTMTALEVPATVTEIAPSAFEGNTSIESVTIGGETAQATGYATGSALKKIGAKAFKGCTNLTDINFATNIVLNIIGSEAFKGCIKLTELIIPEGVTEIKAGALQNLSELTHLVLPTTLKSLAGANTENAPFIGIRKLKMLECHADIINRGNNYGPYDCSSGIDALYGYGEYDGSSANWYGESSPSTLEKVVLNGGTSLEGLAFYCEYSLKSIVLPDELISICDGYEYNTYSYYGAFYGCSNLTEITIPDSVTTIGDYAFYDCSKLTSITLPDSVTTIGSYAFCYCSKLTSITMPDLVTAIGDSAFYGCSSLTEITIPDLVTTIGDNAFNNCENLSSLTIGNSVTTIGNSAFYGCRGLTSITIPGSVTAIGDELFSHCYNLVQIRNLSNVNYDFYADGIARYAEIKTDNSEFSSNFEIGEKYAIFTNGSEKVLLYVTDKTITTANDLPSDLTQIGQYAFEKCTNLTSFTIQNSVTRIGNYAFLNCKNLSTINFENTTGWKIYENSTATTGYTITVTNTATNATKLKDGSYSASKPISSPSTNWGRWYLKRSA